MARQPVETFRGNGSLIGYNRVDEWPKTRLPRDGDGVMSSSSGASDEIGSANNLDELGSLAPGDVVEIWDGGSLVAKTVLDCQETVDGKSYGWRWTFLDDGSLLEASPDGYFLYRTHQVVKQGTDLYEELVAQDGALVRFEERVREGSSGRRPVEVAIDGKPHRLTTGSLDRSRLSLVRPRA